MANENFAPGAGPQGIPGDDGDPAALTNRQLQQIGCVPTTVGLTPTSQPGSGTFPNVTRGSAQIGYRTTTSAPGRTWTGLDCNGITEGQCFQFRNDGPAPFTLAHESGLSLASNQFTLPGARDMVLEPDEHVVLQYEGVCGSTGKWVAVTDADSEGAAAPPLTARQLQQLACVPTLVGMDVVGLTQIPNNSNSVNLPPGGVGYFWGPGGGNNIEVRGMAAATNGQCVQFYGGTGEIKFKHDDAAATGTKFWCPEEGDYNLKKGNHIVWQYSTITATPYWRATSVGENE